jgi:hypothetical protein
MKLVQLVLLATVLQLAPRGRNQATAFAQLFVLGNNHNNKDDGSQSAGSLKPFETMSRRSVFQSAFITMSFLGGVGPSQVAKAAAEETNSTTTKRPYAPVEDLLPAMRVKVFIDRTAQLTKDLTTSSDPTRKATILDELQSLLFQPQNFTRGYQLKPVPSEPAKQYLDSYKKNREQLSLLEQPGAYFTQNGEMDAWRQLKRRERNLEEQDEIRAALNAYTTALSFSADSFLLNLPMEERSKMIREDRLPDIKQVIQADMGRRYLYRNQILTTVEDLRAELKYQLKDANGTNTSSSSSNPTELLELAQEAKAECDQWFSLIDAADIAAAMSVLETTEQTDKRN